MPTPGYACTTKVCNSSVIHWRNRAATGDRQSPGTAYVNPPSPAIQQRRRDSPSNQDQTSLAGVAELFLIEPRHASSRTGSRGVQQKQSVGIAVSGVGATLYHPLPTSLTGNRWVMQTTRRSC